MGRQASKVESSVRLSVFWQRILEKDKKLIASIDIPE
jgi:hypothetical protein|tara:strand:- start:549 stop:659 length:111 start_codon:yes stop_codon:yes gene_type:complete